MAAILCRYCGKDLPRDASQVPQKQPYVIGQSPYDDDAFKVLMSQASQSTSGGILNARFSLTRTVGLFIMLGGIAAAIYFFAYFDVSVTTEPVVIMGQSYGGGQHVNNLGLIADRQNGLMIGIGAAVIGLLLALFGGRRS